jgi:hypothetical protein
MPGFCGPHKNTKIPALKVLNTKLCKERKNVATELQLLLAVKLMKCKLKVV